MDVKHFRFAGDIVNEMIRVLGVKPVKVNISCDNDGKVVFEFIIVPNVLEFDNIVKFGEFLDSKGCDFYVVGAHEDGLKVVVYGGD